MRKKHWLKNDGQLIKIKSDMISRIIETARILLLLTAVLQILPDSGAAQNLHFMPCNATGAHPSSEVKVEFSSSVVDNGKL